MNLKDSTYEYVERFKYIQNMSIFPNNSVEIGVPSAFLQQNYIVILQKHSDSGIPII